MSDTHAVALTHLRAGEAAEAVALLRRVVRDGPDATTWHLLGLAYKALGQLAEALKCLRSGLELDQMASDIRCDLANILAETDPDQAAQQYRLVLESAPNHRRAAVNLSLLLTKYGQGDEALELLSPFALCARQDLTYQLACAHALLSIGRAEEALATVARARALAPSASEPLAVFARALGMVGRWDEAALALNRAVRIAPDQVALWRSLGEALEKAGRSEAALEALSCAVAINPKEHESATALNALAVRLGRSGPSAGWCVVRGFFPESQAIALAHVEDLLRLGEFQKADSGLVPLLKGEASPAAIQLAARLSIARGEPLVAIELLEGLLEASPKDAQVALTLAEALLCANCPRAAVATLRASLQHAPFDQHLLARLATALKRSDDPGYSLLGAPRNLVHAVEIEPPPGMTLSAFNSALSGHLRAIHLCQDVDIQQSIRRGTQSRGHLFREDRSPLVSYLRQEAMRRVADFVSGLPDNLDHPFFARKQIETTITGAWSVRLCGGGSHDNHIHGSGWISAVYYVAVPAECSDIDAKAGWIQFGQCSLVLDPPDQPELYIQPRPGLLILFPSYLWHGVSRLVHDEERITVAFDLIPAL